jgi:RNA polymerase sigma factor (sigma-70 family)
VNYKTGNILDERHLAEMVLRGDTNAFGAIIKSTEGLVAQIVFRMIGNTEDRKDIAQDVYLKAFSKLGGFKFQSKLSTWIGQIAYNTCLNYLEKKKLVLLPASNHGEEENREEALETLMNRQAYHVNSETENLIFQKELSGILLVETENLPPMYKTLITLYHQEELSYEEISQITGLPSGTVKSYLFRARKALKENILAKYKKEEL